MGDFDKNQSASPKSEKKKLIMCCALGAVLLGMGVMHFAKSGPQTASAADPSQGESGGDLVPAQQTPDEARSALSNDPTADLLQNTKTVDASLDDMPRNPFIMTDAWRGNLVKTIANPIHTQSLIPERKHGPDEPILSLSPDDFKLTGVIQGKTLYAIINGEIVPINGIIGKGRVVDIQRDHVVLQHQDSPDGPHLILTIARKLK